MRDYVELAESLRLCAKYGNAENALANAETAADAIEELLAHVTDIDVGNKWISVEERLPKKDEMVIVYYSWIGQSGTEYKEVSLATLEEMRYCGNKLLGWMPLPEPPKEVE